MAWLSGFSRAIAELTQKQHVIKIPNSAHKKSPFIWLTEQGLDLYMQIFPIFKKQAELFTSVLTEQENKSLCNILDKLKANIEQVRADEQLD